MAEAATKRQGQRGKSVEEMVAYAIGHRTRVQILIVLNQGTYSPAQVAEIIGEPLNSVSNHMRELADGGSIEIADIKMRRNTAQHFYRATQIPEYSREDLEEMTIFEAQVTVGIAVQFLLAEIMASLWAGKMSSDPGIILAWDRLNFDEQGRREVSEEQEASWRRITEIEEESLLRAAKEGTKTVSYVTGLLGFEHSRTAPKPASSTSDE